MIRLRLQMFAKSASQQAESRKAKAIASRTAEAAQRQEEEKKSSGTKRTAGEAVRAVKANEQYQIFVSENNKVVPYKDKNGNPVYRTGAQVADKMIYNSNREAWESKAQLAQKKSYGLGKIRKYIVRKLR